MFPKGAISGPVLDGGFLITAPERDIERDSLDFCVDVMGEAG